MASFSVLQGMVQNAARAVLLSVIVLTPARADTTGRWFPISSNAYFADVHAQLSELSWEHASRKKNVFCVVGQNAGGFVEAWVYWKAENKLILWVPDRDNPHAIADSKRYLDLTHDVVDGDDVHGSSYTLTRATANQKIRGCKMYGRTYVIDKPSHG